MKSQTVAMADGAETVIEWYGDIHEATQGVVVFFPALGVSIQYYRGLAEAWSEKGCSVVLVETRGQKLSSVNDVKRNNFGYREVVTQDMASVMDAVRATAGALPLYLAGHSLGGQFALMYASRYETDLAGIMLVAAGSNYHRTLPGGKQRLARHVNIRLTRLINNALGFFPGDKLGFGGRQPKNMINDWSFEGLKGRYRVVNDEVDYDAMLSRLTVPVLMLSLEGDPLVPRSCADYLAEKLKSAPVRQKTIPAERFGRKAASHFGWAKQPEPVLEALEAWRRNERESETASSSVTLLHEV